MKVILLKDISGLGKLGSEVEVKDGYAKNYLIPNNFVVEATKGALRTVEQKKLAASRKEEKLKEEYKKLADKISSISCTISVEAGEEDKLFGAVTSEMIADSLKLEGAEIDKKKVVLDEPIKKLGVYNVEIRLHPDVKTQVKIWVVKK
ncbi:MAG: 50S ribosomal protein L9 [Candidatus Omnitrophica bacterium]|nr:50S ribosomal protein L9 [Candidatus Omnitrophota bacterium]